MSTVTYCEHTKSLVTNKRFDHCAGCLATYKRVKTLQARGIRNITKRKAAMN